MVSSERGIGDAGILKSSIAQGWFCILWLALDAEARGPGFAPRDFVHARTSPHSKERLSSFQGSLESLNCNFHVAPIDVTQLERNQFACPQGVLKANDQQGVISWAPSSSSFKDI